MLYSILHVLVSFLAKWFFRLKVIGVENIPEKEGIIIASNHLSYLDIPLLGCSVKRHLDFMGKKELFHIPALGYIFRILGGFPVDREKLDRSAMREAVRRLNKGRAIVIYPEGSRSRDGKLQSGKPGVGLIVKLSGKRVVPVAIRGTDKAMPVGSWFIRPARVSIRFGRPIDFSKLIKKEKDKECIEKITEKIMEAIRRLNEEK